MRCQFLELQPKKRCFLNKSACILLPRPTKNQIYFKTVWKLNKYQWQRLLFSLFGSFVLQNSSKTLFKTVQFQFNVIRLKTKGSIIVHSPYVWGKGNKTSKAFEEELNSASTKPIIYKMLYLDFLSSSMIN